MDHQALRAGLRGALLQPGDGGYDAARRVWNGSIDRKPRADRAVHWPRRRDRMNQNIKPTV